MRRMLSIASPTVETYAFNTQSGITADERGYIKAIIMAVDRQAIVDAVTRG